MPVLAILFLYLTHQQDPGVIQPMAERDATVEMLEDGHVLEGYGKDEKGRWVRRVITVDGYPDLEKYCTACNIWRPRRGYHCAECGYCMERGDHHCGVVGNCVARGNHRWFTALLCTAWVGSMLMMGGSIWRLKRTDDPVSEDVWHSVESYFLVVLAAVYGYHAVVLLFGVMHLLGLIFDFTTKDIGTDDGECEHNLPCLPGKRNPRALVRSWKSVCCGPLAWRVEKPRRLLSQELEVQAPSEHEGWMNAPSDPPRDRGI